MVLPVDGSDQHVEPGGAGGGDEVFHERPAHAPAVVPGIDQALFDDKVAFSKANCPISKALAAVPEIVVNTTLKAG